MIDWVDDRNMVQQHNLNLLMYNLKDLAPFLLFWDLIETLDIKMAFVRLQSPVKILKGIVSTTFLRKSCN